MKLIKDGVVKDIEKRLVGDYLSAGWKIEKTKDGWKIEKTKEIKKDDQKIEKK